MHTVVQVPVPLLLHGLLEAAVEDLVEDGDPLLHLGLAVGSQQVRALVLHLQLEGEAPHLAVLRSRRTEKKIEIWTAGEKRKSHGALAYLNHAHARVQEDGSFGLLGGVLVLVEVEVVRAVSQLGQVEVPPLEGLEDGNGESDSIDYVYAGYESWRSGTDPHGDADGAIHVAFVQPAMFGHAPLLRSQGGRVLQRGSGRGTGGKEMKQIE